MEILTNLLPRGASGSAGKTSWSGKPELGDYVSVYGFALCYIDAIYRRHDDVSPSSPISPTAATPVPLLFLGGYSYGSMIASHLPARDVVLELFKLPSPDSAENEIKLRAENMAQDAKAYFEMHAAGMTLSIDRTRGIGKEEPKQPHRAVSMGGYDSDSASRRVSRESSRRSIDGEGLKQSIEHVRRKISHPRVISPRKAAAKRLAQCEASHVSPQVAYILISPLLPPIASFTTMFSKLTFAGKGNASTVAHAPPSEEFAELTIQPCICIYGSKDAFTSDRKLRRWTEDLRAKAGSQFVSIRTGSGHFWQDRECILHLSQGLTEWLQTLTPRTEAQQTKNGQ